MLKLNLFMMRKIRIGRSGRSGLVKKQPIKVISKSYAGLSFLPRHWSVQLNQCDSMFTEGEVIIPGANTVFVQLHSPEGYVHCVGSDNLPDLNNIIWGIESLPKSAAGENVEPSLFVRECLSAEAGRYLSIKFPANGSQESKKRQ